MVSLGVASAACAVLTLCVKVRTQYELVKRYKSDCEALYKQVEGVEAVVKEAQAEASDMTALQWEKAIKGLEEPLKEALALFKDCQRTGIIASMFSCKDLNTRLDRVSHRLLLALQLIPIQQHSASSSKLHQELADVKELLRSVDYAATRDAARKQNELVQRLEAIERQQQQACQQVHNQQQQQQAIMALLVNAIQSDPTRLQSGLGRVASLGALDPQQLSAELSDLEAYLRTTQQQQEQQHVRHTIRFVSKIQEHQRTNTLQLALGDLRVHLPPSGSPRDSANGSSSNRGVGTSSSMSRHRSMPQPPTTPHATAGPFPQSTVSSVGSMLSTIGTVQPSAPPLMIRDGPSALVIPPPFVASGADAYIRSTSMPTSAPRTGGPGASDLRFPSAVLPQGGAGSWKRALREAKANPGSDEAWRQLGVALQPQQHAIDLSFQRITDADIEALARFAAPYWPCLQQLNLTGNSITAAGAAALAQHAALHWGSLRRLDLTGNDIGAAGASVLACEAAQHWPQLQHLVLQGNGIGNAGFEALAQHAAGRWQRLLKLDLQRNGINDRGAASAMMALKQEGQPRWPHITELDLRGNNIGDACAAALRRAAQVLWQRPQVVLVDVAGVRPHTTT